jgi:predicted ribosomally synthesized peptide with nif11-like leader
MSKDQVVRLFRDSKANSSLKSELNEASSVEHFVSLARQFGYEFTLEEWKDSMRFSVEELECQLSEIPGI